MRQCRVPNSNFVCWLTLCFLVVAVGCSDSDSVAPVIVQNADVNGTWSLDSGSNPIAISNCTGDLADFAAAFSQTFDLELIQTEASVEGISVTTCFAQSTSPSGASEVGIGSIEFSAPEPTSCGEAVFNGSISGNSLTGSFFSTESGVTYHTTFSASIDQDAAQFTATAFSAEGLSGSCSVSGSYAATR